MLDFITTNDGTEDEVEDFKSWAGVDKALRKRRFWLGLF